MLATIDGGQSRLVGAAAAASGARINLGRQVQGLVRTGNGWRLLLTAALTGHVEDVDAVVLAVPAAAASRLLRSAGDTCGSAVIGALDYASVALVAVALPFDTPLPELSGFLVPPSEGTLVKAATFVTRKWPAPGASDASVIIRASRGHAGDEQQLRHDDAALADRTHIELGKLLGAELPPPIAFWVQRWENGLPQYRTGHLERIAAVRAGLPPVLPSPVRGTTGSASRPASAAARQPPTRYARTSDACNDSAELGDSVARRAYRRHCGLVVAVTVRRVLRGTAAETSPDPLPGQSPMVFRLRRTRRTPSSAMPRPTPPTRNPRKRNRKIGLMPSISPSVPRIVPIRKPKSGPRTVTPAPMMTSQTPAGTGVSRTGRPSSELGSRSVVIMCPFRGVAHG